MMKNSKIYYEKAKVFFRNDEKRNLLLIILLNLISMLLSVIYDLNSHKNASKIRYFFRFFTYWSSWNSIFSIAFSLYKLLLFNCKKNFFTELLNCIFVESNFVSMFFFCSGGFFLTLPYHDWFTIYKYIFGLRINRMTCWFLYNLFWHIYSPMFAINYFFKYCYPISKLQKLEISALYFNLSNPFFYFCYVFFYPKLFSPRLKLPHKYPFDYPYPPFYWCFNLNNNDKEVSKFLFFEWKSSFFSSLIWLFITIFFWIFFFSLLLNKIIQSSKKHLYELPTTYKNGDF